MIFPNRFLDILFLIYSFVSKMVDFGTPFKIKWAPKWHQKSTKWRQMEQKSISGSSFWRSRNKLAPETPPEALLVTFFMIFEEIWNLSDLIFNDFQ